MTSLDARPALPSRPGGAPTPIQAGQLTDPQFGGSACIWCATAITESDRHEVGFTGHPATRLYGCTRCVSVLRRRLPAWPEPGSA